MTFKKEQLNQLYRYALSLEHNADLAYDLLQTALVKYLAADHSGIESHVAYIKRIMRNLIADKMRHADTKLHFDELDETSIGVVFSLQEPSVEDVYLYQSELSDILAQLSSDERELLYLWAVDGYTADEIAKQKQIPRGTVLSRLHRLKKRLQKKHPQISARLRGAVS